MRWRSPHSAIAGIFVPATVFPSLVRWFRRRKNSAVIDQRSKGRILPVVVFTRLSYLRMMFSLALLLLTTQGVFSQSTDNQKSVLVIHTFRRDGMVAATAEKTFQEVLSAELGGQLDYYSESIDVARFPGLDYQASLFHFLKDKYKTKSFEVVIATSKSSNEFVKRYRSELFPKAAMVFVGQPGFVPGPDSAAVNVSVNTKGTLALALALQPKTKQVFVVSGSAETDRFYADLIKQQCNEFNGRVEMNYLTGLPMSELLSRLATLPTNSIIYYSLLTEDPNGGRYVPTEALNKIAAVANSPIYSWYDSALNHGVVGGDLYSVERVTREAAQLALRILRGEKTENIPTVEVNPNHLAVDWRQMRRWGISDKPLPPGTAVFYQEGTFWEKYRWRFIAMAFVLLLQSLLLAGLLIERNRKKKATNRLAESENRYRNVVETQTEMICRYTPEAILTFVNDAYCRYFQMTRKQLIGSCFLDLIPEHSREASRQHIQSLIESPRRITYEHEVIRPDGTIGWQLWTDHLIIRSDDTIELQGIGSDITERKRAEAALRETEERNRAILLAIPDLMFLQTADGVYLDYHAKNPKSLFIGPDEFLGKNMTEVLPPKLADDFRNCFTKTFETGETQLLEFDLQFEGKRKWYEARVARCNGNKVLSVVRNITERKRTLEALITSEEFNRQIVESSTDCIKILDLEGRLQYMSPNGQRLLEIDNFNDFLNASWVELWNGDEKLLAREAVKHAQHGEVGVFQGFRTTMSGKPKWWHTVITPVEGASGGIERLLAISRDITDQKLAEKAVRESEQRFAKAFRANPQPMCITTLSEGRYIDVNDSFVEMSGYSREEIIGKTFVELNFYETPALRANIIKPLLKDGQLRNLELRFRAKSGNLRVLLSSAEFLDLAGERCILAASTDITERKALEEDLLLSEREFSTLVENSPDIISRLDCNLRYIYVSPALQRVTGAPPDRFIGKTQSEASLPGYDWKGFEESCREAIKTKKAVHRAFEFAGKSYWSRIIPEFTRDGEVESLMTISEDVSARIRAEKELTDLTIKLFNIQDEERRRIARELHDGTAQNLFAISINLARLAQLDVEELDEMERLISECQSLGDQSLQEIRTLSYLLHPPLLDQAGLVSALQWYADGFSKRSGIYVDVLAQPIGRLEAEIETALFRIVQEALANVRRHSGSETATIRLDRTNGRVKLEIRDRGHGMKADGSSASNGLEAMGVGIPGMRQRLRQLGGSLEINSNGKGTAIVAVVPLANGASYGANSSRR